LNPEALLEHVAWVRELARALVADENHADDVSQETLLAAMDAPARKVRNLRAWLAGAVRNLVRQDRRLAARRVEREGRAARTDRVPSPTELVEKADLQRYVVKLVLELREPYRSTVLYRYFEGLSVRRIAHRTEAPLETVRTRLRRALDQLRSKLEQQFQGDTRGWRAAIVPLLLLPPVAPAAGVGSLTGLFKGALAMPTPLQIGILFLVAVGATVVFWPGGMEPTAPEAKEAAAPVVGPAEPAPEAAEPVAESAPMPEPGPAPIPLELSAGKIVGVVTDQNDAPIEGAAVTAYRYERGAIEMTNLGSTLTDKDGAYEFEVSESRVLLEAVAAGRHALRRFAGPFSREDFALGVPGVLTGRVLGAPALEPCADAMIGLYELDPNDGAYTFPSNYALNRPPVASVRTDASGDYRFSALRPGAYRIRVLAPDRPELHAAVPAVRIEAGKETVRQLCLGQGITIRGKVTDQATASPIAGALVGSIFNPLSRTVTDANGDFTIRGVSRFINEWFAVDALGYRGAATSVETRDVVDDVVHNFAIAKAAVAEGRVLGPDDAPVAGARLRAMGLPDPLASAYDFSLAFYNPMRTDAEGRFAITVIPSSQDKEQRIYATCPGLAWGVSEGFLIKAGERKSDIVIRLGQGGSLTGKLTDGADHPLALAPVLLKDGHRVRQVTFTRPDGRYDLSGVHEGVYAVKFLPPGSLVHNGSRLVTVLRENVSVTAGRETEVNASLQPGNFIAGKVLDEDDRALEGVAVRAQRSSPFMGSPSVPPGQLRVAVTDAQGRFRIEGLDAAGQKYDLVAAGIGYLRSAVQKKVEVGRVDVQFKLTATKELTGRVVIQATGKPVSEFRLVRTVVAGPNGGAEPKPRIFGIQRLFHADADGRFKIAVPPAVYEFEAITLDGLRSEVQRVEVTAVGEPGALQLAVRSAGALWGTLEREGTGPVPAMIYLWDLSGETAKRLRTVTPDSEGRYEIRSVEAGRYTLEAFCSHPPEQIVTEVALSAGAKKEVNLALHGGLDVGVTVAGADQEPIAGAKVEINRADGIPGVKKVSLWRISDRVFKEVMKEAGSPGAPEPFPVQDEILKRKAEASRHLTETNAEGKLVGWLLIPGDYVLEAAADGYEPLKKSFRVEAGKTNEVVVVLQKAD